jgi:cation:H+ antiporter
MTIVMLLAGLGILIVSGTLLVDGACNLGARYKVSPAFMGLTLVAFGTSLPELAVNLSAVSSGNTGLSLGNIFGSNIANLSLVLGAALVVRNLKVESQIMRREIPLLLLVTLMVVVLCSDTLLRGGPSRLDRSDGVILLLLFLLFVYINFSDILTGRSDDPLLTEVTEQGSFFFQNKDYLYIIIGVVGLALGGEITVANASAIAQHYGVSDDVIGLSVVAVGTSIPELVTSVVAAVKRQASLAVANVVGSNLINSLFILAVSAVSGTLPVSSDTLTDVLVSLLLTLVMFGFAFGAGLKLRRWHGLVLLCGYFSYISWRYIGEFA